MKHCTALLAVVLLIATAQLSSASAQGVISITQARALQGGITPSDQPGFPVTIAVPGKFRLDSNLKPPANKVAIDIAAPNAVLDLNGYLISGGLTALTGISGSGRNATIRDGAIVEFSRDGITGTGPNWILQDIRVIANRQHGMSVGDNARIEGVIAARNGSKGIICGAACRIEGSIASGNGLVGMQPLSGLVIGNLITGNKGFGIVSSDSTGYTGNTLIQNNGGQAQTTGPSPAYPNACAPPCP